MGGPGAAALIGNSGQVLGFGPPRAEQVALGAPGPPGPIVTAADVRLVLSAVYMARRLVAISSGPLVILPYESGWQYDTASGRRSAVLPRDTKDSRPIGSYACDVGSEEVGRRGGRGCHGCSVVLGCARVGVPAKMLFVGQRHSPKRVNWPGRPRRPALDRRWPETARVARGRA